MRLGPRRGRDERRRCGHRRRRIERETAGGLAERTAPVHGAGGAGVYGGRVATSIGLWERDACDRPSARARSPEATASHPSAHMPGRPPIDPAREAVELRPDVERATAPLRRSSRHAASGSVPATSCPSGSGSSPPCRAPERWRAPGTRTIQGASPHRSAGTAPGAGRSARRQSLEMGDVDVIAPIKRRLPVFSGVQTWSPDSRSHAPRMFDDEVARAAPPGSSRSVRRRCASAAQSARVGLRLHSDTDGTIKPTV